MNVSIASNSLFTGNAAYATNNYLGAVTNYTLGIDTLTINNEDDDNEHNITKSLLSFLYSNRSAASLLLSKGENALTDASLALAIDPLRSKFHGRLGAALHFLGRYQEALKAYEKGLAITTDNQHIGLQEGLSAVQRSIAAPPNVATVSTNSTNNTSNRKRQRSPSSSNSSSSSTSSSSLSTSKSTSTSITSIANNPLDEFVADVSVIGTTVKKIKRAVDDSCLGTASEELARILQKNHIWINLNPYEVLALPHDIATVEDIKQRYRALCGTIHPDKCNLEGARAAFEYVSIAHKELSNLNRQNLIKQIIDNAHLRVMDEIKKEEKNQSSIKIDMTTINNRKVRETRITFAKAEEARRKSEKNQQAYRKRESDQTKEEQQKLKSEYKHEKNWQSGVDSRVEGWQNFAGIKKSK